MKHIVLCVVVAAAMLSQCTGCRTISDGCDWVALGVIGWRNDARNSKQRKQYTNAYNKNLKKELSVVSLYNENCWQIGKKMWNYERHQQWTSLFSDGSFIAIDKRFGFFPQVNMISGTWERDEGTSVVLTRQDGTNFVHYATLDLSSVTNFPSSTGCCSFHNFRFSTEPVNITQ